MAQGTDLLTPTKEKGYVIHTHSLFLSHGPSLSSCEEKAVRFHTLQEALDVAESLKGIFNISGPNLSNFPVSPAPLAHKYKPGNLFVVYFDEYGKPSKPYFVPGNYEEVKQHAQTLSSNWVILQVRNNSKSPNYRFEVVAPDPDLPILP